MMTTLRKLKNALNDANSLEPVLVTVKYRRIIPMIRRSNPKNFSPKLIQNVSCSLMQGRFLFTV
jgi:hypothetical protein